jgi:hypothetical protein
MMPDRLHATEQAPCRFGGVYTTDEILSTRTPSPASGLEVGKHNKEK